MSAAKSGGEILIKIRAQAEHPRVSVWEDPLPPSASLVRIFISYGDDEVNSIQTAYRASTEEIVLTEHRGGYGKRFETIELPPGEYITSISGQAELYRVASIKFDTNIRSYGPFGSLTRPVGRERNFCFNVGSRFGGFHGRLDEYTLHAIGVYVKSGVPKTLSASRTPHCIEEDVRPRRMF